jgi:hypothetical protein
MAGFSRDSAIGIPVREFGPRRLLRPIRRLLRNSIPESSSSLVHFRVSGDTPTMMTSEKPTCQDLKEELLLSLAVGARAASNLTVLRNRKNLLGVDHSTM